MFCMFFFFINKIASTMFTINIALLEGGGTVRQAILPSCALEIDNRY
ncbi:Uncharacterised protein [Escherichia coli]|nr:Uncharacterised protein [Escherichia coli]